MIYLDDDVDADCDNRVNIIGGNKQDKKTNRKKQAILYYRCADYRPMHGEMVAV